jgi:glutaredoxin 3
MDIKRTIKTNPLVVFGLSYCPYCHKAKELLAPYKPVVKDIDLNKNANGTRRALKKISGMKTFPQIFLKGRLLGGYEDTSRKIQTRKVKKSLESLKPSASFF